MVVALWALSAACSAYDSRLVPGAPALTQGAAEGGMDLVQDGGREQRDAQPIDAGDRVDASLPDCFPAGDPDCPTHCRESCNGVDDDCDGNVDEFDSRSICVLHDATSVCTSGACLIASCNPGHVDCNDLIEDGCEATLDSIAHCGQCSHSCSLANATPRCSNAKCLIAGCEPGFGDCDHNPETGCERALDTLKDCGACGKPCAATHAATSCAHARCAFLGCHPGFGDCNGDGASLEGGDGCETDLSTSKNCGACGHVCPSTSPYCSGGKCSSLSCPSDKADCDGDQLMCEASLRSLENCSACGVACGPLANADVSCSTGTCTPTCKGGWKSCDGVQSNGCETDLLTNTNCGDCGVGCTYANATTTCATGSCQLEACKAGYGDCNGALAVDGCEQPLNTNTHCGACGRPCALAHAIAGCSSGTCQVGSCSAGYANCDGRADTGCEVALDTDSKHCGACNLACPSNRTCQGGRCVCTGDANCGSGQVCCAGSCVDTRADDANCGGCGNVCSSGTTCCSGTCKNLATDTNNCGGCGTRCGSNTNRCTNGQCRCANDNPCGGLSVCCANGCRPGLICF